MKRSFILLPILLLASAAFAAPGPAPEGFAEYKVELPRDLRLMAGRGELSPVRHALVTIAAPADLHAASDLPILVISATSDPGFNSSRRLLAAYADAALKAGWIAAAFASQATPADHRRVQIELTRAGFHNVRIESFPGGHEVNPLPLRKALDWFREVAGLPVAK